MTRPGLIRAILIDGAAVCVFFAALTMAFIFAVALTEPDYSALRAADPVEVLQ